MDKNREPNRATLEAGQNKAKTRVRRYSTITAHPDTETERARIDNAARTADARWEQERAAAGRMTLDEARKVSEAEGRKWAFRQDHGCSRSKTRRATKIRVLCEIWTKVSVYTVPGLVSGQSLDHGVCGRTWEEALKLARCKAKLLEINRRNGSR